MTRTKSRFLLRAGIASAFLLGVFAAHARAATAPLTFNIGAGSSFAGALGGNLTLTLVSGTGTVTMRFSSTIIFQVTGSASATINMAANQTAGITLNTANNTFNVQPAGSFTVHAQDDLQDATPGVLDGGIPGSDGKWDDADLDSVFTTTKVTGLNATVPNINANATILPHTLGGSINGTATIFSIPINVNGNLGVQVASVNAGLSGLTIGQNSDTDVVLDPIDNFGDGNHVLGNLPDLSGEQTVLQDTAIDGTVGGAIAGNVNANINTTGIVINLFNGPLLTNQSLGSIAEAIDLDEILPMLLQVLHHDTANLDYDDVSASIQTGTAGQFIDIPVDMPITNVPFNTTFAQNTGSPRFTGTIGGNLAFRITGNLQVKADIFLQGQQRANDVNVVPEPTSLALLGLGALGIVPFVRRRLRQRIA